MLGNGIQQEADPVLNGNETVLVVDDFESVRTLLDATLPTYGYSVICAEDGMDGLKKVMENIDKIRIVLLDVVMPRLNGVELFREIEKLKSNIKVLFMTGYSDILEENNLRDKTKCISKPFKIKELIREMREILDH